MDKTEWTDKWQNVVRGVYAAIVGTVVIVAALFLVRPMLEDGELTMVEGAFAGGLVAVGFIASMPWIFMPVLSAVLKFFKRKGGES